MIKKIAIIGSNGFLASAFGQILTQQGHTVSVFGRGVPTNYRVQNYFQISLLDISEIGHKLAKHEIIIYCAGAGIQFHKHENEKTVYDLNLLIPIKICYELNKLQYEGTFITFGSYFEIGVNTNYELLYNEVDIQNSNLIAPNDYTISKRLLTKFTTSYRPVFKHLHFILPTIFGENESEYRLIPYTIKSILTRADISFTSGDQLRQYIYVNDVVELISLAVQQNIAGGVYNIGGTEQYLVKDLVSLLYSFFNQQPNESCFGLNESRSDVQMKSLRLNSQKLDSLISLNKRQTIRDVYTKYRF